MYVDVYECREGRAFRTILLVQVIHVVIKGWMRSLNR